LSEKSVALGHEARGDLVVRAERDEIRTRATPSSSSASSGAKGAEEEASIRKCQVNPQDFAKSGGEKALTSRRLQSPGGYNLQDRPNDNNLLDVKTCWLL
jgi:hypothetical protein